MKKLVALLLLAAPISIVKAQLKSEIKKPSAKSTFSGTVVDAATGKPLAGATVQVLDLKLGLVTDTSGNFRFQHLPAGNFLVGINFIGYKPISKTVSFNTDVKQSFKLEQSYAEANDVVVTGQSKATLIKRSPVPIVAVSHAYLVENLNTNAIDALVKIPGVRAVTTGPNVSKPFIRGLGYNRILTLFDGVRQEGQQWGDEHGIEVDAYNEQRVEIIKGPASLSYGSDALAGVVNIIPTQPAPEGKMIGDVTSDYQSNNKYIGGSAMLGATKNGLEWMGRISHKQAVDYQDKYDGRVFGTAFRETDANASVGLHRSWGYLHLNFVLFDDTQEIPDGSRDSATGKFTRQISEADTVRQIVSQSDLNSYKIEPLHQHVQHYRLYWSNNFILGNSQLAVNFGYQYSHRQEFSHPVLSGIPGLNLKLNTYTYDVKYHFAEKNNWDVSTGINGMYQTNNTLGGTEFIIPDYHQFDIGGFFTAKKSIDKLDLAGGIRYDVRSFKNDQLYTSANPVTGFDMPVYNADTVGADKVFSNYSKTFSGVSGSLGGTYNFNEQFSLKANLSRGFRAPNIAEISANGVHPGTNIYQIGNPNFKPEFSFQQDLGFAYSSKYVVVNVDVFNNTIYNYIYNQKLTNPDGSDLILVPGNQTFQFQAAKAHLYGGEASIDIHPIKILHFENSISVVYGDNKGVAGKAVSDSAKYLPFIPPTHGISELRLDFSDKNLHFTKGFAKVEAEYFADQNRAYIAFGTETRTPCYTLINAGLGGTFNNKKGKPFCSVYLLANNIFDVAYQDHLSRLKYFIDNPANLPNKTGIYNMGRNLSIKLDFPLNFDL
jgi:iron complex outermembrane receptor protein